MRPILPVVLKDFYKVGHPAQHPKDTTLVYSNFTPRGTRRESDPGGVIALLYQYFCKEYLVNQFNENFFALDRDAVVNRYKRIVDACLGPGTDVSHIGELHELGYLPLKVKAVPEGTLVPYRVPTMTIRNTDPKFFWLTNMVETLLSNVLWQGQTSATTALQYMRKFKKYGLETGVDPAFFQWQGHDFSMRGLSGIEAACLSGFGHLIFFTGTDTIPAICFAEEYYGANVERELVGGSVPATEHSVMCMDQKAGEFETFSRLLDTYRSGILSVVSDTWDLWTVIHDYLPRLKEKILARNGKLVIRPDSGDPVKILLGDPDAKTRAAQLGVVRGLAQVFGTTTNAKGYLELDPHIGWIYGDSITPARQEAILTGMRTMNYATAAVLGIGSFTYQYATRDTDGWAMKATYGEVAGVGRNISKDPITDNGVKKSASGLLRVTDDLRLEENQTWAQEDEGILQTIFEDGFVHNFQTLAQIRARAAKYV